jgi:hypothetical protein
MKGKFEGGAEYIELIQSWNPNTQGNDHFLRGGSQQSGVAAAAWCMY